MLAVLNITAPLFTLIGLGYLAVKTGIFPGQMLPGLGRFVLYFCIPGVILSNLLRDNAGSIVNAESMLAYGLASVITLGLSAFISRVILKKNLTDGFVFSLGSTIPNSMFIGFPILLNVMPEFAVNLLVLAVLVENLVMLPIILFLIEWSQARRQKGASNILKTIAHRIMTNPILMSVFIGLSLSSVGFTSPAFLQTAFDMLAKAAAAAALIVIGGSLVGSRIKGDIGSLSLVAGCKLLVHPLMALLTTGLLLSDQPMLATGIVLIAASPMLSIYPIIAGAYGLAKTCASILLLTTLASFVTINLILTYLI